MQFGRSRGGGTYSSTSWAASTRRRCGSARPTTDAHAEESAPEEDNELATELRPMGRQPAVTGTAVQDTSPLRRLVLTLAGGSDAWTGGQGVVLNGTTGYPSHDRPGGG